MPLRGVNVNSAVHEADVPMGHGQSEPTSFVGPFVARRFLHERLEQMRHELGFDAGPPPHGCTLVRHRSADRRGLRRTVSASA